MVARGSRGGEESRNQGALREGNKVSSKVIKCSKIGYSDDTVCLHGESSPLFCSLMYSMSLEQDLPQ